MSLQAVFLYIFLQYRHQYYDFYNRQKNTSIIIITHTTKGQKDMFLRLSHTKNLIGQKKF
jgi:hypothetical protein